MMQILRRLLTILILATGPAAILLPYAGNAAIARVTVASNVADTRSCSPAADTIPRPIGYVNDFEGLFTPAQRDSLEALIARYERRTSIEIALVTIDSSLTPMAGFDNFTLKMFNAWGVGKKGANNGVLIGISRAYRMIRIQNGYGIEKILSNAETKTIIDNAIIPRLKQGRYFEGALSGLKTIMQRLE